ncbi:hypothetical protein MROS_0417 [Melioribacter roseus P3M-2]|uniref:Tetratricopeptide repeat protein n=1 Tax=Melioribacter roseus (strain DSM 23840 / JCM 17771 / VKM B-2668 / P3M-2) TaxID=1191523 RepID=I6Z3D3_MELRP|nr:hypothetical protein [Melioribacter roseus]AFN73660.1 hypothetical protein MROS_0417 [Melioribacter roseus P3M-2]
MKKLLLIFFLFFSALSAQNSLESIRAKADSLYKSGNYFDAITEYKRLRFFAELTNSPSEYSYYSNFMIGKSYKAGARFDDAVKYFFKASLDADDRGKEFRTKIEMIKVNILRGTLARADEIIEEIEKDERFGDKRDSLNYWRAWINIFNDKWDEAYRILKENQLSYDMQRVCRNVIEQKYSVTFAKTISYIVPGSGLIYTGNYLQGFMSLGYNLLFGYFTAEAFAAERIFDGMTNGALLWLRFYRGNIQAAERNAYKRNKEIYNKALAYFQLNYDGAKP